MQAGEILVNGITPGGLRHYHPSGTLQHEATGPAYWSGAAIDAAGHWLTAFINGSTSELLVHDVDGSLLQSIPIPEVLSQNGDVSIFADGTIAICDSFQPKVELYTPAGTHLMTLSPPGMLRAFGSVVDAQDTLWVTDFSARRVWHFERSGTLLGSFPIAGNQQPADIDEADDGTLWLVLYYAELVQHYGRDGTLLGSFPYTPPGTYVSGIAVAPDGSLWVGASGSSLHRFDASGTLLGDFALPNRPWFLTVPGEGIGSRYCSPAQPNSTGMAARMRVEGSTAVLDNDVTLVAEDLPPGEFGYFLVGSNQGQVVPPGSQGVLCLTCGFQGCSGIGRYNRPGEIIQGPVGSITIDLSALPLSPAVAVQPGDAWNFQCWFRDVGSSNFSDAVRVLFH
ncbi:MAG: hypothetical protein GY711_03920 [bacterium]|nr:hypothetical protein [bacterium]